MSRVVAKNQQKTPRQLWENSTINALQGCEGAPLVLARQDDLLTRGFDFYVDLYEALLDAGVPSESLTKPSRDVFNEFLPPPPPRYMIPPSFLMSFILFFFPPFPAQPFVPGAGLHTAGTGRLLGPRGAPNRPV